MIMPALRTVPLILAALVSGLSALAGPVPAISANVPSYATPEETIHGQIRSIDGQYHITVRDVKGYLDHIALHQGTLINPAGLTLEPRMSVTIFGYNAGHVFVANEIDTPFTADAGSRSTTVYNTGASGYRYTSAYTNAAPPNPLTIFNSPSYPVVLSSGYPVYGAYGYGSGYLGYPMYSPFGYRWPYFGSTISIPRGYPWSFVNHPTYGPGYWPYH